MTDWPLMLDHEAFLDETVRRLRREGRFGAASIVLLDRVHGYTPGQSAAEKQLKSLSSYELKLKMLRAA
jgi:hypothetical protein